ATGNEEMPTEQGGHLHEERHDHKSSNEQAPSSLFGFGMLVERHPTTMSLLKGGLSDSAPLIQKVQRIDELMKETATSTAKRFALVETCLAECEA
ncbi:MAG: hypothetical protein ACKPKO_60660, partial [Candidatus Fonsibacter sp.]